MSSRIETVGRCGSLTVCVCTTYIGARMMLLIYWQRSDFCPDLVCYEFISFFVRCWQHACKHCGVDAVAVIKHAEESWRAESFCFGRRAAHIYIYIYGNQSVFIFVWNAKCLRSPPSRIFTPYTIIHITIHSMNLYGSRFESVLRYCFSCFTYILFTNYFRIFFPDV